MVGGRAPNGPVATNNGYYTDGNKMHQNVAFPAIKFHNFLHIPLPARHRSVFDQVSFGRLVVVCRLHRGE